MAAKQPPMARQSDRATIWPAVGAMPPFEQTLTLPPWTRTPLPYYSVFRRQPDTVDLCGPLNMFNVPHMEAMGT